VPARRCASACMGHLVWDEPIPPCGGATGLTVRVRAKSFIRFTCTCERLNAAQLTAAFRPIEGNEGSPPGDPRPTPPWGAAPTQLKGVVRAPLRYSKRSLADPTPFRGHSRVKMVNIGLLSDLPPPKRRMTSSATATSAATQSVALNLCVYICFSSYAVDRTGPRPASSRDRLPYAAARACATAQQMPRRRLRFRLAVVQSHGAKGP
jgi:hypothetical protein